MALIATKTIAEGGTREGSLDEIVKTGTIYWAVKSMPWPGAAAVSVSLTAIRKARMEGPFTLNGKSAATISPYIDSAKGLGNPYRLAENADKSFQGSIVLGSGFVLEPEEAQALIVRNPKYRDVLFPYLNGEDLNTRPDGSPSRWVINFFDWPLLRKKEGEKPKPEDKWECAPNGYEGPVAEDYPDCLEILERLVKPERLENTYSQNAKKLWWQYERGRPELYRAIAGMERVMGIARVSRTVAVSFYKVPIVTADVVVTFPYCTSQYFGLIQSNIHFLWAYKYSSTMKGDLRYSPSDCFETFPFPQCLRPSAPRDDLESAMRNELEAIGKDYYEYRAALMLDLNLGLTKTYKLFHDAALDEAMVAEALRRSGGHGSGADCFARLTRLRELHAAMDRSVLKAYGWVDLKPEHGFYELDFLPENDRVRYTIAPETRRVVLERLLELNFRRKAEEG